MADARTIAPLARLDGNDALVVHGKIFALFQAPYSNVSLGSVLVSSEAMPGEDIGFPPTC
jgi:hypothetical protein